MKIVIGLGNFGKDYENTIHNAGFIVVDKVLKELKLEKSKQMCNGVVFETNIAGEKVYFAKPTTFMNNSGECVISLLAKFDATVEDIFVVVDDIDLDRGHIRIRPQGSAGTHKGLKSIVHFVGEKFARVRVGVGKPNEHESLNDYVLGRIDNSAEQQKGLEKAASAVLEYVRGESLDKVMQKYNG